MDRDTELNAILMKTLLEKILDQQETIEYLENKLDAVDRLHTIELEKAVDRADHLLEELHNAEQEILRMDREADLDKTEAQGEADYQKYLNKAKDGLKSLGQDAGSCDCPNCQLEED